MVTWSNASIFEYALWKAKHALLMCLISDASNLCTAVGGDQNKEFRGNISFLREKDPRGGIRIYCHCIFHIDQKVKNHKYSLYNLIDFRALVLSLHWVCLHSSHRLQYTICVYLSWALLYIVPWYRWALCCSKNELASRISSGTRVLKRRETCRWQSALLSAISEK